MKVASYYTVGKTKEGSCGVKSWVYDSFNHKGLDTLDKAQKYGTAFRDMANFSKNFHEDQENVLDIEWGEKISHRHILGA